MIQLDEMKKPLEREAFFVYGMIGISLKMVSTASS